MKNLIKLLVVAVLAICATLPASAATSKGKEVSTIVTRDYSSSIDCDGCVKKVMNTLPNKKGVKDVEVDLKKKIITVQYDSSKCSDANVIKALAKIDIQAKVINNSSNQSVKTTNANSGSTKTNSTTSNKSR